MVNRNEVNVPLLHERNIVEEQGFEKKKLERCRFLI